MTAPSSSPGCWPVCAPTNCCAPTSATCAAPTTARSSRSAARATKTAAIPVEPVLVDVLEHYLDSRKTRFPHTTRRSSPGGGLAAWPASAPLFVGGDGQRITRGTLQYRVLRAFRHAGIDGTRASGALLHGLRHTFATELANADVSVYALMNLLGHESMTTSQRYVTAAGTDTRTAAAQNKLYGLRQER